MRTTILILKGCDGRFTYCPDVAVSILRPHYLPGEFDTAEQALDAVRRDTSVPRGAVIRVGISKGDAVRILPEWRDPGDESIQFVAVESEDGGRVKIEAQLGLAINPVQVVEVRMLERVRS